jgi:hypothetical protein
MRTKTLILSALLGALGSVSVNAQNVYSLNAVGYINVTLYPGYNMVSCPLWATDPSGATDNTLSNLFVNTNGQWRTWQFYGWNGNYINDSGTKTGFTAGGTQTINPGQAIWVENPSNVVYSNIFVGTVPTGLTTNVLSPGFNLIGSVVPASGDIVTNSIMNFTNAVKKDQVYVYYPSTMVYSNYAATGNPATWNSTGDPILPAVGGGLWYFNGTTTGVTNYWVENYTVNP